MLGIDVSTLQGVIDWEKVYKDGVRFAMIKATQGRGESVNTRHLKCFGDSKFKANMDGALKVGMAVGAYHYFTAISEAEAQAEAAYFCNALAPYKDKMVLWACVDVESKYLDAMSPQQLYKAVRAFMDFVKRCGYKPILYTNPNYIKHRFPVGAFDKDEIWLAHWNVKSPMPISNMRIWQYGEKRVSGIKGNVDANKGYFPKVIPAICRLAAMGVINTPSYWLEHYGDIEYLDELIINAAEKITKVDEPLSNIDIALARLKDAGVMNTPEYWKKNAGKVKYLTDLILKLGGAV
jgi:lysozyme